MIPVFTFSHAITRNSKITYMSESVLQVGKLRTQRGRLHRSTTHTATQGRAPRGPAPGSMLRSWHLGILNFRTTGQASAFCPGARRRTKVATLIWERIAAWTPGPEPSPHPPCGFCGCQQPLGHGGHTSGTLRFPPPGSSF